MGQELARTWKAWLFRGICAVAIGVIAWTRPHLTFLFLIVLFGIYALEDGVTSIATARRESHEKRRWWPTAFEAAIGIGLGIFAIAAPARAATIAFMVIAIWCLTTGFLELIMAVSVHRAVEGEWLLGLNAALRIVFGFLLLSRPTAGLFVLVTLTAFYAIASGFLFIGLALVLRHYYLSRERGQPTFGGGYSPQPT